MSQLKLKGATSGDVTLKCADVAGTTTATFPATTGNIVTTGDTDTVTSAMLTDNIDIAGTLDVTGKAVFDNHVVIGGGEMTDAALTIGEATDVAIGFSRLGSGQFDGAIELDSDGNFAFRTGSHSTTVAGLTERVSITTDGKLRTAGSSNSAPAHSFHYDNDGLGALCVQNPNTTAGASVVSFAKGLNSTATSNFLVKFFVNNFSSGSGGITANGTSQAAFGTYSDERLKENIVNLPSQLENIKNLRPVEFDYKTGGHQIGFVAQEFQTVYPDAVGSVQSEDDPEVELLTISGWSKTEARLVKALQEAIAKIETLETKVAALEAGE